LIASTLPELGGKESLIELKGVSINRKRRTVLIQSAIRSREFNQLLAAQDWPSQSDTTRPFR